LATLKSSQVYMGASYIAPHVSYANATAWNGSSSFPVSGVTSEGNVAKEAIVPDFYAGWASSGPVNLGLAVTAPWGLETAYAENWVGQNSALDSKLTSLNVGPTISYQINSKLALGASVNAERISVNYSNAIDVFGDTSNSDLSGSAWGYGYSAGALYTPWTGTNIGISYRSRVKENIGGTDLLAGSLEPGSYNAYTSITLPDQFMLSLSQQLNQKWTALASAMWTHWALFNSLNIDVPATSSDINQQMDWENTWTLSLGGKYQLNSKWALMAGTAMDQTPTINATRDARIPDSNRYWLTGGFSYQPTQNLEVDLAYERIIMESQSINVQQTISVPVQVAADYSGYANIIAMGVRYTF
jgi:long-chain fatty acid transport protein